MTQSPPPAEPMPAEQFDRRRFKVLVHYTIAKCPPESLGKTKLHKVAYYSDMLHWLRHRRPLSGETYVKMDRGPFARHMSETVRELVRDGAISETAEDYFGFMKMSYRSHAAPDLRELDGDTLKLIDHVVAFVCFDNTARSISELSHHAAWEAADKGEEIPYFTALMMLPTDVEQADLEWAALEARTIEDTRPKLRAVHPAGLRSLRAGVQ